MTHHYHCLCQIGDMFAHAEQMHRIHRWWWQNLLLSLTELIDKYACYTMIGVYYTSTHTTAPKLLVKCRIKDTVSFYKSSFVRVSRVVCYRTLRQMARAYPDIVG